MTNAELYALIRKAVEKANADARKPDGPWVVSPETYERLQRQWGKRD
jgi:hypothetical protein